MSRSYARLNKLKKLAHSVVDWFEPLNRYKKLGSILKIDDINSGIGSSKGRKPLYCFAISAKRYALFNIENGKPALRKASAQGLGHLLDPYTESEAPADIPAPVDPLREVGVWNARARGIKDLRRRSASNVHPYLHIVRSAQI